MGNINIPTPTKARIEKYMEKNNLPTKGMAIERLLAESKELEALNREVVLLRRLCYKDTESIYRNV